MRDLRPEEVTPLLGEGFHTALRRIADSAEADKAWHAFDDMDDDEWHEVLMFVVEGMNMSGIVFQRVEAEDLPQQDRPDDVSPAVTEVPLSSWAPEHHELFPDNRPE